MNRRELWNLLELSVRTCFPERAALLLAATEEWLEPGPWSIGFAASNRREAARLRMTPVQLIPDFARALAFSRPEDSELVLSRLETWFRESLCSAIGAETVANEGVNAPALLPRIQRLAQLATEIGVATPALGRVLSLRPEDRDLATSLEVAVNELDPTPLQERRRVATRHVARDFVQGRIDLPAAAFRIAFLTDDIALLGQLGSDDLPATIRGMLLSIE